jgi:DNA-directed RNA polymerase specialized sigma24 family protein
MATKAITETYDEFKDLVYHTCLRLWKRWGGDFDEMVSEAHELFMDAYNTFDYKKSPFKNWIVLIIERGLIDTRKKQVKRAGILGHRVDESLVGCDDSQNFNLTLFMSELTEDGQIVVRLLLEANKNSIPRLRKSLTLLGWSAERILESFDNVTKVLNGD